MANAVVGVIVLNLHLVQTFHSCAPQLLVNKFKENKKKEKNKLNIELSRDGGNKCVGYMFKVNVKISL